MSLSDYIEKKRLEKEREIRNRIRKKRAISFAKIFTGATLGTALGILIAPKSGKETRKDIKNKAKEGKDFVYENVNEIAQNLKEKTLEIKDVVSEKYDNFANRNMTEIQPETLEDVKEDKEFENSKEEK